MDCCLSHNSLKHVGNSLFYGRWIRENVEGSNWQCSSSSQYEYCLLFSYLLGDKKDFKKHNDLPIARIKRIMKSDQDVRMISAETPVIFARACEMFIMDITIRATQFAEYDNERLVLTKKSILDTIKNTDIFDFLMEIH